MTLICGDPTVVSRCLVGLKTWALEAVEAQHISPEFTS